MGGVEAARARPLRTGMLGGTFDPPHLAHLALAAAARHTLELDRVLFVPAGDPWRKSNRREITPGVLRVLMLEAALSSVPWAAIDDIELRREGPSYTTETIEVLAADGGEWWFIMGADALADMPQWHEPWRIVTAARLAVARRPGEDGPAALVTPELRAVAPGVEGRIDLVPFPLLEISSTDLRERVRDGRPTEFLLPEAVRAVIDEYGLYR
jgi:nicotinate-nucleotide adenylyltransferase